MKKEKRCDTPDFMAELNGDSDETAADLANLERFISEDTSDGIINADTFKDLISEIHDLPPEFMEEFDFDTTTTTENKSATDFAPSTADGSRTVDSIVSRLKQEEVEAADREIQAAMLDIGKSMSMNAQQQQSSNSNSSTSSILTTSITTSSCSTATLSTTGAFNNVGNPIASFPDSSKSTPPIQQQQQQQRAPADNGINRMPAFGNSGPELSPAALTLKQMAEQHQHKAQMGMTPAAMTPSTGLSAPPTMANQGAPLVPPHHPPNNMRMRGNNFAEQQQQPQLQQQQQYNNPAAQQGGQQQQQQPANQFMNRTPYTGQGGYGPNSPMIKKEMPYFANSPLGGNSPGPGRPVQQQQGGGGVPHQVPGAKSSPVPMSQTSPMGPPTPQQMQQQQQQQQFNARKAPTPTNATSASGRTPPPSAPTSVQFSQTQQQQMHMSNNGQQIQVIPGDALDLFLLLLLLQQYREVGWVGKRRRYSWHEELCGGGI